MDANSKAYYIVGSCGIMAWPYGGNWDGLTAEHLPSIMASLATAYNERRQALDSEYTPTQFTTNQGPKSFPSPADFHGMEINGTDMRSFMNSISFASNSLIGRQTTWRTSDQIFALHISWASYYDNGTLVPHDINSATSIPFQPVDSGPYNTNFWNRQKDILDSVILFKIFPSHRTTSNPSPTISNYYANTQDAWQNVEDNTFSGALPELYWRTESRLGPEYRATNRGEVSTKTVLTTARLSGDIVEGGLYATTQTTSLKSDTGFILGNDSITIGSGTGTQTHFVEYSLWDIGVNTIIDFEIPNRPTDTPFNGTNPNHGSSGIGELRAIATYGLPATFGENNSYLVLDISCELTDQA